MKKTASKALSGRSKQTKAVSRKVSRPVAQPVVRTAPTKRVVPSHEKHLPMISNVVLALGILVALAALILLKVTREINERYSQQMLDQTRYEHQVKMMRVDELKKMEATPTPSGKPAMMPTKTPSTMMKKY